MVGPWRSLSAAGIRPGMALPIRVPDLSPDLLRFIQYIFVFGSTHVRIRKSPIELFQSVTEKK